MELNAIDIAIIFAFFSFYLLIGIFVARQSGKNATNFFLSGRNMPWWLLGVSMVATTFAADTPGLVAGIVRQDGVSGNWIWWCFLLTGMLTVFFYSKLWRKSNITTDLEFYELRYSGKSAAFLRGFRAIYLGVFFNIVIMSGVCLAAIKIGHVIFDLSAVHSLLIACSITTIYSLLGGLKGVLLTDFLQFSVALGGSIWAAYYIINLDEIGSLQELLSHPNVSEKLAFFPDFSQPENYIPVLIIPLAVQWWSVWYPGAEPGGGGYIVQRMLAAKDKNHATKATLFFNIMHYAVRPWPWILMGLGSLIIYPDITALADTFPNLNKNFIKPDLSYAAMLKLLPSGLIGLVITSLIAAFMSTISTHLNWGSSYVVNDFYTRFINPQASAKQQVIIGRISIVFMMVAAALLALVLEEAREAFNLLLQIGAGTGLLFIVRWFWMRVNPYSEITAMSVSFLIALVFFLSDQGKLFSIQLADHWRLVVGVVITSLSWIFVSLITKPSASKKLNSFSQLIFDNQSKFKYFKAKMIGFFGGIIGVYGVLFGTGFMLYDDWIKGVITLAIAVLGFIVIFINWKKVID